MRTIMLIIFASVLLSFCFGQKESRGYLVKEGDKAPNFEMLLTTGKKVALGNYKGKVIMLQFTASWCGVCRKEMPFIEKEIWQKYKSNEDFVLIGIDRDEPIDKVKKFAFQTGISYPLALDPGAKIFSLFALKEAGVTRNVIIDKSGKIVMLTRLFEKEEFEKMKKKIKDLLDE